MQRAKPYQPPSNGITATSKIAWALLLILTLIVFIGVAYSSGTSLGRIVGAIQLLGMCCASYVASLPLVVLTMYRKSDWYVHIPKATTAAGVLFLVHIGLTSAAIELVSRQPMVLDYVPYCGVIEQTVNIVGPGSLIGFSLAIFVCRDRRLTLVRSCVLMLIANSAALLYAQYFFTTIVGDRLTHHVWWWLWASR